MHVCLCTACVPGSLGVRKGSNTRELERESCEPLCGFWKLNLGPLEEQQVLFTHSCTHTPTLHPDHSFPSLLPESPSYPLPAATPPPFLLGKGQATQGCQPALA